MTTAAKFPSAFQAANQENLKGFFEECFQHLEDLNQLFLQIEKNPKDAAHLNSVFRKVHTLKGGLSVLPRSQDLSDLLHHFESLIADIRNHKADFDVEKFDFYFYVLGKIQFVFSSLQSGADIDKNLISEIKLIQSTLQKSKLQEGSLEGLSPYWRLTDLTQEDQRKQEGTWITHEKLENLEKLSNELIILRNLHQMILRDDKIRMNRQALDQFSSEFTQNLSKITDQLQGQISSSLNIEFSKLANKLSRIVRQTSAACNKKTQFETYGFDLSLDRKLGQSLVEALIHMVRNSIDHGIEESSERKLLGKPESGLIQVHIWESDGEIKTRIRDDGSGIDLAQVRKKALRLGLTNPEKIASLSETETLKFIFHPGFSTREIASSVSGRGVGMDVVASFLEKFKGRSRIETLPGQGTEIFLEIPIPRKVMVKKTILTRFADLHFGFPIEDVEAIESAHGFRFTEIDNYRILSTENGSLPVFSIREMQEKKIFHSPEEVAKMSIVIIQSLGKKCGVLVHGVDQQIEIVIRPFSPLLKKMKGFSGHALLGEDAVAYTISAVDIIQSLPLQRRRA